MQCAFDAEIPLRTQNVNQGFTLVEVVVATALVVFALAGIFAMHGQSMDVMRSARDSSSASQVLQQRVEQLRMSRFDAFATSSGLATLMDGAAGATDSEREMAGVRNFSESVTMSVFPRPGVSPVPSQSFTVMRANGAAKVVTAGDLRSRSPVNAELVVTWTNRSGAHSREFATVISQSGVTSANVSDRADGSKKSTSKPTNTPSAPQANPPPSQPKPPTTPAVCRHGRPWPHCGRP